MDDLNKQAQNMVERELKSKNDMLKSIRDDLAKSHATSARIGGIQQDGAIRTRQTSYQLRGRDDEQQ